MSETLEKNVVTLLEEHVEHAISTVQVLREEKRELEAEVERLNSDLQQRDARIQELESQKRNLEETAEQDRLATEEERSGIRKKLEALMAGLEEPNEGSDNTDAENGEDADAEDEVTFTVKSDETDVES